MVLGQRRVYILPTSAGLMFAVTLVLLLIGSINYNLSLGFVLTFLLAGIGVVSILHTWRNLARVALRPAKTRPVFAGDSARFHIVVANPGAHQRLSLAIQLAGQGRCTSTCHRVMRRTWKPGCPRQDAACCGPGDFAFSLSIRSVCSMPGPTSNSTCTAWSMHTQSPATLPCRQRRPPAGKVESVGAGEEDFAGLRTYNSGDSPRRIAWKAFARSDVFLTKQFSGSTASELWLNLADIPEMLGLEARLSRLTRWVIEAETAASVSVCARPESNSNPSFGASHRDRCLQAIALYKPARE